jgi:hypothetical protein
MQAAKGSRGKRLGIASKIVLIHFSPPCGANRFSHFFRLLGIELSSPTQ